MTKEEAYKILYSEETIYVPPHERTAAALELGTGCAWHQCTFCDFRNDKFCIHPLSKVRSDLKILKELYPDNENVFFLGENAFFMSTEHLLKLIAMVKEEMPYVKSFGMYSHVKNIVDKSDEELKVLKANGVDRLHIGIESGCDFVLQMVNKGITSEQIITSMKRLDAVGIEYYVTIIAGLGGKAYSKINAIETARVLNSIKPKSVWCMMLTLWENTPLYEDTMAGRFELLTPLEALKEEYDMVSRLKLNDCEYHDSTVLKQFTIMVKLPEQKEDLLRAFGTMIAAAEEAEKQPGVIIGVTHNLG